MSDGAASFWRYSLRLYERRGVPDALLTLQDAYGADVNVILYLLFAGAVHATRIGPADLKLLTDAAEGWNRLAVRPLRALRRDLKPLAADSGVAALREDVKRLELSAERIAQSHLVAALPLILSPKRDQAAASANLRLYLSEVDDVLLAPLLAAADVTR